MSEPLMYSNNIDLKYPLSDFHEYDIPNDILMNLSLSMRDDRELDPVVGALRIQNNTAFLCIENKSDGAPIATVLVDRPQLARVYPLTMDIAGFGWITFGPGAIEGDYYSGSIAAGIDPECVTRVEGTSTRQSLSVNGIIRKIFNSLSISSETDRLLFSVEDGVVYIDRNDDAFSTEELVALTEGFQTDATSSTEFLTTINNIPPDASGNFEIDVENCIPACGDNREMSLPRGDTSAGEIGELPLDIFTGRDPNDTPCSDAESSSSSSSSEADPFEGCSLIVKQDILDIRNGLDKAIGTLYTAEEAP